MKRHKCPFCGKRLIRDLRALLADKYCRNCIKDRILSSGGQQIPNNAKVKEIKPGYCVIE